MNNYTLVITEKPDAAQRIASALDKKERPRRLSDNGVPYYVAKRDGREIVVVPARGHLYTIVDGLKRRDCYPVFSFKWVPRSVAARREAWIRNWLQTITTLAKKAEAFVDACDFDVEGCVIGYSILKYACVAKEKEAKRMKFSTLTKQELEKAYAEPLQHLDFGLIEAGLARHEIDWLYGINLSRALTVATRKWSGKYTTLSTGRVQGPTLKFLVEREEAIRCFVPTPCWRIKAQVKLDGRVFKAKYMKERVENKKEAETVSASCRNRRGHIEEIAIRESEHPPPFPFDLGTLQREAYSLFGYPPRRTLSLAQKLYLDALISYPRTDSQKLPQTIDYATILRSLVKAEKYSKLTSLLLLKRTLKPNEGNKEDSAHPAIYPTGNLPRRPLEPSERKLWDLVVRRFLAVFSEPSLRQNTQVYININGHRFLLSGKRTLFEGWTHYYAPYFKFEEVLLPPMKKGQTVKVKEIIPEEVFNESPPRYNPSSLLKDMEEARIGTKATRADVIQRLYDRRYIEGERMTVTSLGFEVFDILQRHCPQVVSTALTRELEEKMDRIRDCGEKREHVLRDVIMVLRQSLAAFKEQEKVVGKQLSDALEKSKMERRIVGACPVCKTGNLIINYSRKTGKRFVGCTNYFEGLCQTSFPLPQRGTVEPTGKNCPACRWPTVKVCARRREWILCFNSECPSRAGNERS